MTNNTIEGLNLLTDFTSLSRIYETDKEKMLQKILAIKQ